MDKQPRNIEIFIDFYWKFLKIKAIRTWLDVMLRQDHLILNDIDRRKHETIGEFMFSMASLYFIIISVGSAFTSSTWIDGYYIMNQQEKIKFESFFNVKIRDIDLYSEIINPGSSHISLVLNEKIGAIDSISVSNYFRDHNMNEFSVTFLSGQAKYTSKIIYFIAMAAMPLMILFHAHIVHYFLSSCELNSKFTPIIYIHCFFLPIFGFLDVCAWWYAQSALVASYLRFPLSLIVAVKCGNACNSLYNSGVIRGYLTTVFGAAIIIIPLYMALLLSISSIM